MNNSRSLLTLTGGASILLGVFFLVVIISRVIGMGLNLISTQDVAPDMILKTFQNGWYQTSLLINLLSYLILVPALIGIYYFLKREANGYALIGLTYGGIAFILFLISDLIEAGLILWLTQLGIEQSYSIKNDAFLIYRFVRFLSNPALIPYMLFFFFWGTTFKRLEGKSWFVGILFLSEILIIMATIIFSLLNWGKLASIGIIIEALVLSVSFILAGQVLFSTGKEEPSPL